ncbi:primosomal replication protein PriC [Klebsiella pneumoniae]
MSWPRWWRCRWRKHATFRPRFDRQLFHTRSTLMAGLIWRKPNTTLTSSARPSSASSCRKWSALPSVWRAQSAALRRETTTRPLRSWDHVSPTLSRWQRRRPQHQEYERRLPAMRDQRQRVSWRRRPALTSSSGWGKKGKPTVRLVVSLPIGAGRQD